MSAAAAADSGRVRLDARFLRQLDRLGIDRHARPRGQPRGERRHARRGGGVEFLDYRDYQPGDDLRHVDWHVFARLDRLVLKLRAADEDLSLNVLVDSSASMALGEPSKFDHARRLSAALAYVGLKSAERVSVHAFAGTLLDGVSGLRGRGAFRDVLRLLDGVTCAGETSHADSVRAFVMRQRTPGITVVVGDLLGADVVEAAKRLRRAGQRVLLVQLLAEEDISPPLDGALQLEDAESGERLRVDADRALRDAYAARLAERLLQLERETTRTGIDYVRASTAVRVEDMMLRHLRRAALLR